MTKKTDIAAWSVALVFIPGMILTLYILLLPLTIFYAWALQKMYDWFILPLGAPHLNLWHVLGILYIIYWFLPTSDTKNNSAKDLAGKTIGKLLATLLMLLMGLILRGHIGV